MKNGVIYVTPKGWEVRELSSSQHAEYADSPAKFKWKRIQGYSERLVSATSEFGHAIQAAVQANLEKQADPEEIFKAEWVNRARKRMRWPHGTSLMKLNEQGIGLMKEFKSQRAAGKYRFKNIVFPQLRGNPLKVHDPATGCGYQSIPDMIAEDELGKFCCDMKALGKPLGEDTPGLIVNDPQLRTQSAVTGIQRVALWVFVRTPARPQQVEVQAVFDEMEKHLSASTYDVDFLQMCRFNALQRICDMTKEEAAQAMNLSEHHHLVKGLSLLRQNESPPVIDMVRKFDEFVQAILESIVPTWKIQWLEGHMNPEWAKAAVADELSVIPQIQAGWFPCRCGVRWPNDSAHNCPYRGLCLEEATACPTEEQLKSWRAITKRELIRFDEVDMSDL